MAKTSMIVKCNRKQKFSTREYTRCQRCGRPHSVYRKFGLCRVCFRELALKGELPGVKKASVSSISLEQGKRAKKALPLRAAKNQEHVFIKNEGESV